MQVCRYCAEPFESKDSRERYCSDEHRRLAKRERQSPDPSKIKPRKRQPKRDTCENCGKKLIPPHVRWCDEGCAAEFKRNGKGAQQHRLSDIDPGRYKATCSICGDDADIRPAGDGGRWRCWRGEKPENYRPNPKPRHKLSDIDETTRMATCSECGGRVKLYGGHSIGTYSDGHIRKAWWCSNRVTQGNQTPKRKKGLREARWRSQGMKDLTEERWDQMLIAQNGRCDICGMLMKDPQTDHDHGTGEVRALLCIMHNTALGYAGEDEIGALHRWLDYLDRVDADDVSGRFCPELLDVSD